MHSRKIVALILYVSSYLSCSNSRTFVSISGHAVDKNTSQHFLGSKTESGFWSCGGGGYSTAVGFVRNFAAYAENMPFPVVVWAGDAKRTGHAEFMVNSE